MGAWSLRLVNEFSVDAPLDVAWSTLTDIGRVAECIPGASIEAQDGDDFQASVAVKVGPVGLTLSGAGTIVSRDDTAHEMVVRGQARDRKGNGSAEATVTMLARESAGRSAVTVTTDLELGGRIAQFGSGVILQVSDRIIGQFVSRLNAMIAGVDATDGPAVARVDAARPDRWSDDRMALALTALAGVVLGLAIGRTVERLA